jgi:methionyl-tRNA formyltransferase
MSEQPRIVFFGTPQFAVPSLSALVDSGYDIVGVVTAPDKPAGRSRTITPSPVKQFALSRGLKVIEPKTLKDDDVFAAFSSLAPELCVVVAYGKIIPSWYLQVPRLGFLNVHPSLLPRWRGPSPIQTTLMNGETETGVSIMQLDEEMDHGPLLGFRADGIQRLKLSGQETSQAHVVLDGTEYLPDLSAHLSEVGASLLVDVVALHMAGVTEAREQNHELATYCKKVTRTDARIDWSMPATKVFNLIRAMAGEPSAWFTWHKEAINVLRAAPHIEEIANKPGIVFLSGRKVMVATGHGAIELQKIQPAGKRPMDAGSFINGHRDFVGSVLK